MIRWIVGTSLKYRYIVLALAAALMLYGMAQLPSAPVDVFPEFAPPRVEIQTPSLGLSAEEVEALVTVPLEQAFNGVEGLDIMRSKSIPDLSSIELLFKTGHRRAAGPAVGAGAPVAGAAHAADLGRPAGHDAAGVDNRPRHEDRALLQDRVADGHVDDRLLDDPRRACCVCPASPTWRSGASGSRCRRSRSTRRACRPTMCRSTR